MTWIDALAVLTLGIGFYCGWRAGLIAEFFDAGSLFIGFVVAGWLAGGLAAGLPPTWPLSEAARHLMAFWLLFLVVYAIMRVIGWFAVAYRDWPGAKWIGSVGGGLIAVAKVLVAFFVLLYLALFLPVDAQVRDTLRKSPIAIRLDAYFPPINDAFIAMTPRYYKLIVRPIMNAHRI
jgi:uncharacterized membrane protein required for colicin V production